MTVGRIHSTMAPPPVSGILEALLEQKEKQLGQWQECAERLYEAMDAAIKSGDWKIDGACDPDLAMMGFLKLNGKLEDEVLDP